LFIEAGAYHANDGSGPVTNLDHQKIMLGLVAAHLAQTYYGSNGAASTGVVGQVTSASQGTASISVQPIQASGTQAFWLTTPYGANYWRMTAPYRLFRYLAPPQRVFDPLFGRGAFPMDGGGYDGS
jgi:hypothetical protein